MGRVAHQKSVKQSGPLNGVRGSKIAKQRKNHRVVIESESQDKEKSRAVLSFRAEPPPGYTFIPAGNPQLTSALKEFAKKGNHQILAVTTTPHASRHELSREVHRIGFHFPTEVVSQVCNHYGIRLTSGGKLVEEKDDDKLFMRLYQKGQLVLDEKVLDQVTINTEAKQIIKDLFPHIPDNDLFQIIKTAFQLGDGKVGTADEIPLVRRAQLSVVAHIRHTYTRYDKLLRSVPYSEARHQVESITLQKLIDWRGDEEDDKNVMDDTLREVVVISDEEDSDEVEEGQLLENDDLRVQPVSRAVQYREPVDGRPRSPIEVHSDDETPRGYRYLAPVVRRLPVQDLQAVSIARQQSRYAVWDRVRQEYRSGGLPPPTRVIERIPIDEPPLSLSQGSRLSRESLYITEPPPRRVPESPAIRMVAQPSPPTYVRGADGKLYERIIAHPEQAAMPSPVRRPYTPPPTNHSHRPINSRPSSPRPQPPRLHRRTESYDNNDGSVLPSIEGPSPSYRSPVSRQNPFGESNSSMIQRNAAAYESNQRQGHVIDLTHRAEQASARRAMEEAPYSPYTTHAADRAGYHRNGTRDDTRYKDIERDLPSQYPQQQALRHDIHSHRTDRGDQYMEPIPVHREGILRQDSTPIRYVETRQLFPSSSSDPYYSQPIQRLEYANSYKPMVSRSQDDGVRQHVHDYMSQDTRVVSQYPATRTQVVEHRVEPATRYVRTEIPGPFPNSSQAQYRVQELPYETMQREYNPPAAREYLPSRDISTTQIQGGRGMYSESMAPPPLPPTATVYRDERGARTTYVQH